MDSWDIFFLVAVIVICTVGAILSSRITRATRRLRRKCWEITLCRWLDMDVDECMSTMSFTSDQAFTWGLRVEFGMMVVMASMLVI